MSACRDLIRVRGRGCEIAFDVSDAEFDESLPELMASKRDPSTIPFTELWEIRFGAENSILVARLREPLDTRKTPR